jgi:outer membrane protein assembly factor BamE (lipoprotein component of BamABCDE complex)
MSSKSLLLTRSLSALARAGVAAGLFAGALAAQAAPGFTVQPRDEQLVKVGMTQDEVRAAIGVPTRSLQFKATDRTTWTYLRPDVESVFDVDFSADGKVVSATPRMVHFD